MNTIINQTLRTITDDPIPRREIHNLIERRQAADTAAWLVEAIRPLVEQKAAEVAEAETAARTAIEEAEVVRATVTETTVSAGIPEFYATSVPVKLPADLRERQRLVAGRENETRERLLRLQMEQQKLSNALASFQTVVDEAPTVGDLQRRLAQL